MKTIYVKASPKFLAALDAHMKAQKEKHRKYLENIDPAIIEKLKKLNQERNS